MNNTKELKQQKFEHMQFFLQKRQERVLSGFVYIIVVSIIIFTLYKITILNLSDLIILSILLIGIPILWYIINYYKDLDITFDKNKSLKAKK